MTKEQFLNKYFINTALISPDLDAVIAYEIKKAKAEDKPAPNPIREAYDAFKPIRHKEWGKKMWIKKHSENYCINEKGIVFRCIWTFENPEDWELYTEAEAEQVTAPAKPKFDKDRFERVFCAVVANSGHELDHKEAIKFTEEALQQLDAYYATKKGGENG